MRKPTYSVVVVFGGEVREHCGHKHRTVEAARDCLKKKTVQFCSVCGERRCKRHSGKAQNARWYNAVIRDNEGKVVN
jgi:hypothetical protein